MDAHPDVRMSGEMGNQHPCKENAAKKLQTVDKYFRNRKEKVRGLKLRNFWVNDVAQTEMRELLVFDNFIETESVSFICVTTNELLLFGDGGR